MVAILSEALVTQSTEPPSMTAKKNGNNKIDLLNQKSVEIGSKSTQQG